MIFEVYPAVWVGLQARERAYKIQKAAELWSNPIFFAREENLITPSFIWFAIKISLQDTYSS